LIISGIGYGDGNLTISFSESSKIKSSEMPREESKNEELICSISYRIGKMHSVVTFFLPNVNELLIG
jgi:hypothetical protein